MSRVRITFEDGPRKGEDIVETADRIGFGRAASNAVVIGGDKAGAVSLFHCEVFFLAGCYHLRDLGSTHGTLLNGEPVTIPSRLRNGDTVQLGPGGPRLSLDTGEHVGGTRKMSLSSENKPEAMPVPTAPSKRWGCGLLGAALVAGLTGLALWFAYGSGPRALAQTETETEAEAKPGSEATAPSGGSFIRLATGSVSGTYYALGNQLQELTSDPRALVHVQAQRSAGSVSNIHMLLRGESDAAIVQSDVLYAAVNGNPPFAEPLPAVRALATLYGEQVHVVAREGAGVATIQDLAGTRVVLGAQGSGAGQAAVEVLAAHGVERTAVQRQRASLPETLARFRSGQIDAFVHVAAAPNSFVAEALAAGGALVPADPLAVSRLVNRSPFFRSDSIEPGTYPGLATEIPALRIDALLAAREDMRAEIAYELLRMFFEDDVEGGGYFEPLKKIAKGLGRPNRSRAKDLFAVPLHRGAMSFYGERSVFDRPVTVHTGIYANDVFNLDIAGGTFDIDFYLWFRYQGRLHADPSEFRFEFMNGEVRQIDPPVIDRFGGHTHLSYKVVGRFRTSFPLHRYPFDAQVLPIKIEHPIFESSALKFTPDQGVNPGKVSALIEPGVAVDDWGITQVTHRADDHIYQSDMGSPALEEAQQVYSQYIYEIEIRRTLGTYLVKFCVPLAVMVLVAFLVFFIPAKEFQTQVILVVASLLSCVAFHTTQVDNLPRVGYMVTADLFFVLSYCLIFLTLGQIVIEHWLYHRGRDRLALRLDRIARWTVPSLAIGAVAYLILS
ncbi:MAG: TAXI family TRAP transporter solute-binding subunit [Planctomycetota bacterium]